MSRTNPLHEAGLTADTVKAGDRIVVYVPQTPTSAKRYTVVNTPFIDDDDDQVVTLRTEQGEEYDFLTSEAGLSGGRYDGIWTHVALIDTD